MQPFSLSLRHENWGFEAHGFVFKLRRVPKRWDFLKQRSIVLSGRVQNKIYSKQKRLFKTNKNKKVVSSVNSALYELLAWWKLWIADFN